MATTFDALAQKLLTLRRQVPFGTTPRPCDLNLLERGRRLALLEGFCFSTPRPFTLASIGWQQGNWEPRWGGTHPAGWKRGPDHHTHTHTHTPGGTRRGTDLQEPGIGRRRLLGTQVYQLLGLRKGICKGHLGGVSTPSQGKLLPAIARRFLG